ncbi:MAG: SdiA-regulated domain-containing protein [Phycisphaeraceae bacterium]|nr:SdiA-regulated domain-containing protein [Phycisphaeraceae bacterium]
MHRAIAFTLSACLCLFSRQFAAAQVARVDLSEYRLAATVNLPTFVDEASAIAYNPDTGRLYIIGDEGLGIGEFTRAGAYLGAMTFSGFQDTEGLTYTGNGRFVVAEERLQNLYELSYVRFGSVSRATLPFVSLGPETGNSGIEGIAFEPRTGLFFAVKEKTPQRVLRVIADFGTNSATVIDQFFPASLGLLDLADIAVLSTVPSLVGTADQDNLLIISQESARVVKCTRAGVVLQTLDLAGISATAEGIAIDERGVIFIVDETPRLYIFERACPADFDHNGALNVGDIFAFLIAWFAGNPAANFDGAGGVEVGDVFSFLAAWFAGCG